MHGIAHPEFEVPMRNAEHFHPAQVVKISDLYRLTWNVLLVLFLRSLFGRLGQVGLAYLLLRSHHNHAAIGMQVLSLSPTKVSLRNKCIVSFIFTLKQHVHIVVSQTVVCLVDNIPFCVA